MLGEQNRYDGIRLEYYIDDKIINTIRLGRQWVVLDGTRPDFHSDQRRFGINEGRWNPLPVVRRSEDAAEITTLIRFDRNGADLPLGGTWVLRLPLEDGPISEVRNQRAVLCAWGLERVRPEVWTLASRDQQWLSYEATWNGPKVGATWWQASMADHIKRQEIFERWQQKTDLLPAVRARIEADLSDLHIHRAASDGFIDEQNSWLVNQSLLSRHHKLT